MAVHAAVKTPIDPVVPDIFQDAVQFDDKGGV